MSATLFGTRSVSLLSSPISLLAFPYPTVLSHLCLEGHPASSPVTHPSVYIVPLSVAPTCVLRATLSRSRVSHPRARACAVLRQHMIRHRSQQPEPAETKASHIGSCFITRAHHPSGHRHHAPGLVTHDTRSSWGQARGGVRALCPWPCCHQTRPPGCICFPPYPPTAVCLPHLSEHRPLLRIHSSSTALSPPPSPRRARDMSCALSAARRAASCHPLRNAR